MYICHNFMWLRWIRWMTDCFQLTVGWYREGGCIIVAASMVILVAVDHTSFAKWGSTSFRFSLVSLKSAALWGAGNEVCLKTKSPNIHWRKCESLFSISKGYLIGKIWEHTSFLPTKTLVLTQHAWMILWQDPQPSSLHRHPWRRRGFALPGSYPSWLAPHNWHQQYWLPPPMFISYMRVILKGTIHSLVPSNFAWPLSIVLFPTKKGSFTHSGVDQIDWPRFQPLKCCALHPPSSNLWPSWSVHYPLHELVPHLCLGSNERFSIFFQHLWEFCFVILRKEKELPWDSLRIAHFPLRAPDFFDSIGQVTLLQMASDVVAHGNLQHLLVSRIAADFDFTTQQKRHLFGEFHNLATKVI